MTAFSKRLVLSVFLASLAWGSSAVAGPVWICSIVSARAVEDDGTIGLPDLGGLEQPTFIRVDVDKKEVMLLAPDSRRGEVTKIEVVRESGGQWQFTGMEEGRIWSLIINATGHVTLSVVADGMVWSVFGHALPEHLSAGRMTKAESK